MNTFKFRLTVLFSCIFIAEFFGGYCLAKDKLNIVATIPTLASIAESVGGDHVSVTSIGKGEEDPHFIQAKPSFMMKAKKADLWICVGMELEVGYEGLILQGSRNRKIQVGSQGYLDVSEGISKLELPTGKVSRGMGDVHPMGNPHYWMDPYNGRIIASTICRRLKELDPDHGADYDRNLAAFLLKLDIAMFGSEAVKSIGGERLWQMELNGTLGKFAESQKLPLDGWYAKMKPFEHAKIVTYHRSWPYFAERFDLDVVAELEPKPGIPPGPAHILEVINTMKAEKAKVILTEVFYNRADADSVAAKTGAKVIVVPTNVTERKDSNNYVAMLDNIITQLAEALSEVSK